MQSPASKQPSVPGVQVTLDGKPVELAIHQGRSLQAIRTHLEALALRRGRVLFALSVNGKPVSLGRPVSLFKTFHKVVARTVGFNQLGFQLIAVAEAQVDGLHERIEQLSLQIMINDWTKAEELWHEIMPELKDPLLTLSFIPNVIELLPNGQEIGARAIKRFSEELVVILEAIDLILARQELLEFSNVLENQLLPWLRSVGHCIYRFHGPDPA